VDFSQCQKTTAQNHDILGPFLPFFNFLFLVNTRSAAGETRVIVIARVTMVQAATTAAASATGVQETPAGRDGD